MVDAAKSYPEPLPFGTDEVEASIPERLRRLAELCPDDPALGDGVAPGLSFGALWSAVESAGRDLLTVGLERHDVVAVLMPHEPIAILSQYAALAAGFTVSPLDHLDPPGTLKGYLEEAQPAALICSATLRERAEDLGFDGRIIVWDALPEAASTAPQLPTVVGTDPAYLLFTSGSTGRPKGVTSLHRAFLRPAREVCVEDMYHRGDRVALAAPLSFMAAVDTTLWVLAAGAELCMFSVREHGPAAFAQWMGMNGITGWGTAVAALRAMAGALAGRPLPKLRVVMVGGEVMHTDDLPLFASMSQVHLDIIPVYASTEIPLMGWQIIDTTRTDLTGSVPIGQAAAGITIELEPEPGRESDPDQGEIVLTAPIGSLGYLSNDTAAERFTFDEANDLMTYRTGDVGRRTADGSIEIVGRTDTVVKIRGLQVHLSVVEGALRSHPDVTDAIALTTPEPIGGLVLVAHVTGESADGPVDAADVRNLLRRLLPAHMVPTRIVVHETLPMTTRGKIDRAVLEAMSGHVSTNGREPRNATEQRLLATFESLLDRDDLTIDDDFFEAGGDSLGAVQLLVVLEQEFGLWQPMSTWMEAVTVAEVAATIAAMAPGNDLARLTRIQPGNRDRPPLNIVYDLHGGAFRFKPLGEALGTDQELWGLENPLLDGRAAGRPRTIEQLASIHVRDLVERFGDQPIHLVGYSGAGSFTAYEIARQLIAGNHNLGFLCLIDFGPVHLRHGGRPRRYRPPGAWPDRAPSNLGPAGRLAYYADSLRNAEPGGRLRQLSRLVDTPRLHDLSVARLDIRRHGAVRPELRLTAAWYEMMDMCVAYRHQPIDASATLLVSDQTAKGNLAVHRKLDYTSLVDPMLGWGPLIRGGIDRRVVVGQHNDLMEEPYLGGVGAAIRLAFDDWLAAHAADI